MTSFSVDAQGLKDGSNGFSDKAVEIAQLASNVEKLADPGTILAAAGNDGNGRSFVKTFQETASQVAGGVRNWANAYYETAKSLMQMAQEFSDVDASANDIAKQLAGLIGELSQFTGGGGPTDSQPGSPTSSTHHA